jgi:hypothetical protein
MDTTLVHQQVVGLDMGGRVMNKQEIDALMRDLPSQKDRYEEPLSAKISIGVLFVLVLVLASIVPDLARF